MSTDPALAALARLSLAIAERAQAKLPATPAERAEAAVLAGEAGVWRAAA